MFQYLPRSLFLHFLIFGLFWLALLNHEKNQNLPESVITVQVDLLPEQEARKILSALKVEKKISRAAFSAQVKNSRLAEANVIQTDPLVPTSRAESIQNQAASDLNIASSHARAKSSFVLELRAALEHLKEYPSVARSRRQTGKVEVGFTLTKAGKLEEVRIVEPCSFEKLNLAALSTVSRLDHFKPIPDDVSKNDWKLVVPIEFKLE